MYTSKQFTYGISCEKEWERHKGVKGLVIKSFFEIKSFQFLFKNRNEFVNLISEGRSFQTSGAAKQKALSPKVESFITGLFKIRESLDLWVLEGV